MNELDILDAADQLADAARDLIWALRGDSSFQISSLNLMYFTRLQNALDAFEAACTD